MLNFFCYVAFKLKYDLILGKPCMKKLMFNTILKPERLWIRSFRIKVENNFEKKLMKLKLHADIFNKILYANQNENNENKSVFSEYGQYR